MYFGSSGYAFPAPAERQATQENHSKQAASNGARNTASDPPAMGEKVVVPGVRNFGEVTPTLFRGGNANQEGLRNLAQMGVAIVVDLRLTGRAHEREEVTKLGMQFVQIPWECFNPNDSNVARFLKLLRENTGKKIFVHCYTGDDRTGMEVAAFRMAEQGWTEPQARKEMEAFGFGYLHRRICPRLGSYETHFPQRFATSSQFARFREDVPQTDDAQNR